MKRKGLNESIAKLADLFPYGHLMAQTDPTGFMDRAREEIVALRSVVKDVATNYDHDEDAHKYGTHCRMCIAQKVLDDFGGQRGEE